MELTASLAGNIVRTCEAVTFQSRLSRWESVSRSCATCTSSARGGLCASSYLLSADRCGSNSKVMNLPLFLVVQKVQENLGVHEGPEENQ